MPKSPRELLDLATELIEADLEAIRTGDLGKKLPHQSALDLARYASSLLQIAESAEGLQEEKRASVSKIDVEELEKRTKAALKALKAKQKPDEDDAV